LLTPSEEAEAVEPKVKELEEDAVDWLLVDVDVVE
jgi:hypothetical protein